MPDERITWKETRRRLARDRARLLEMLDAARVPRPILPILAPAYLCVWLYRLSHYLHRRGRRRIARLLYHLNLVITGADLNPLFSLGGGLVIPSPPAVSICGHVGRDVTMMPLTGIGGLLGERQEDIGAGPGLPVVGDGVHIAPHAGVLGPVRIGDGARLEPGCIVTRDVPAGAVVESAPLRVAPRERTDGP